MERFEILSLQPIRRHLLWRAEILVRTDDVVEEVEVSQNSKLTVRFSYDHAGSVQGLLEAAYSAAKRCLLLSSEHLEKHSLEELLDQEQEREEAFNRSLQIFGSEE